MSPVAWLLLFIVIVQLMLAVVIIQRKVKSKKWVFPIGVYLTQYSVMIAIMGLSIPLERVIGSYVFLVIVPIFTVQVFLFGYFENFVAKLKKQ